MFASGKRFAWGAALAVVASGLLVLPSAPASANPAGTGLVINEVYGGGGNNGGAFDQDFVELFNKGTTAVRVNAVTLVPDPKASPLAFRGAFIQPSTNYLEFKPARDRDVYQPANGYCLPPTKGGSAPVLVLRIGPTLRAEPVSRTVSRNNSVNVDYTTQDGDRYVAVYPYQFEYPNQPD